MTAGAFINQSNTGFQSTRSERSATDHASHHLKYPGVSHFNPRAPSGARLRQNGLRQKVVQFQSTRSERSATKYSGLRHLKSIFISIHALRAERDRDSLFCFTAFTNISIHALRAERDHLA